MREGTAPLIRREDYAAPPYWIRKVDLTFDLDPAKTMVINRMQIERNGDVAAGPLRLNGEDITLTRCLANGESVSFRHEDGFLVIDSLPEGNFTLEIRNTCSPEKNTRLSGLYTSGNGFFTQCEAEGFRRITFFLDRPDVMAEYTVLMRANKAAYPVLLSNGNLLEQGELGEPGSGRHFAKWHDPFPKPSYLFALVAADLVDRDRRRLRGDRVGGGPRVFPQLDRQPHHLPRLVPAEPEGRPDGLSRPGVQHGHAGQRVGAGGQAHPGRAVAPPGAVPRRRRPDGASGAARQLRRDQQFLHADGLRERRRGRAHDADAGRPRRLRARHHAVLLAARRPCRHLRRFRPVDRRREPGQRAGEAIAAVQALVRAGRHAARHRARPLRRAVAHLHARRRAIVAACRWTAEEGAVRDPAGRRPGRARRCGHGDASRRRAGGGDVEGSRARARPVSY